MTTEEAIQSLIAAAQAEGKSLPQVIEIYRAVQEQRSIASIEHGLSSAPQLADEAWQAIRTAFQRDKPEIAGLDKWVIRLAQAVRTDNQAAFWRALIGLGLSARTHLPHLSAPTLWEEPHAGPA